MKHIHQCNTDNPTRPCCWQARAAELAAMKARESTPEWQAKKAADNERKNAELADSFIGKGID